ncbi:MAG: 2-oxo acid dehydrogenase subunit E2 [Actinomycetota bacterium]|nr:2-oxo acid dehydrogenase subunit E2 [Actinomycetota bacterium]
MSSSPTSTGVAEVTMPQMGVSVAEGTVVEWKKRVGEWVEADEPIVEISTDKVETEVPSPASGRVASIAVEVGETVDVGTVLATIAAGDAEPESPAQGNGNGTSHAPPISPVVRRMAEAHHLDLSQITGTGRRGRVTKKDVLAFLAEHQDEPVLHTETPYREEEPAPAPAAAAPAPEPPAAAQGEPLSVMRKAIGEHMVRSLRTAAHCTTVVEADMSRVEEARGRLSYLPLVARATIAALREHPRLNATLEGDRLTIHEEINLGIAVALGDDGLIVPVVHNAHELSHEGLASRIADLAERARAGRLSPDETKGGTFTITNPGRYGALLATPIINQPQVAILDLEAVVPRPVVVGGDSIAIRPMTYLCMSWDHRALDGVLAARFLGSVKRHLEEWNG